jgi:hypothetical protein
VLRALRWRSRWCRRAARLSRLASALLHAVDLGEDRFAFGGVLLSSLPVTLGDRVQPARHQPHGLGPLALPGSTREPVAEGAVGRRLVLEALHEHQVTLRHQEIDPRMVGLDRGLVVGGRLPGTLGRLDHRFEAAPTCRCLLAPPDTFARLLAS